MMIASPFWGWLTDRYGRRWPLIWASLFLFYFGLLCSFAPSFKWLLFLRFLVGFFIGCVPQVNSFFNFDLFIFFEMGKKDNLV